MKNKNNKKIKDNDEENEKDIDFKEKAIRAKES